jgi:Ca-activated chloride channel family protein
VRRHSGRPHLPHISRTQLIAPAGAIFFWLLAGLSLRFVPNSQAQNRGADQRSSIRVDVSLVSVIASVLDANNRPAPDLKQEQFEIYEEGKPQKIEVFEPETQQPLDLALMIDSSLSEIKELQFETDAAARFIAQVVRPDDRVGIFQFADTVTQLAGFSGNVPQLQAAVKRVTPGDGTALYDAVYLGSDALGKAPTDRRKVLILITDAGETTSRADFETARRAALRAEALIYTIVIRPVKNENGRNTAGEHALETIADSTGGAMYYPDEISQLDAIFERINRELRTQYRLAYYPQPRPPQGSYRSIEVRVKGNYKVRYRKSYYSGGVTN